MLIGQGTKLTSEAMEIQTNAVRFFILRRSTPEPFLIVYLDLRPLHVL